MPFWFGGSSTILMTSYLKWLRQLILFRASELRENPALFVDGASRWGLLELKSQNKVRKICKCRYDRSRKQEIKLWSYFLVRYTHIMVRICRLVVSETYLWARLFVCHSVGWLVGLRPWSFTLRAPIKALFYIWIWQSIIPILPT